MIKPSLTKGCIWLQKISFEWFYLLVSQQKLLIQAFGLILGFENAHL
jgi:hypothetical protein